MQTIAIIIAICVAAGILFWRSGLITKNKLGKVKDSLQNLFVRAEKRGLFRKMAAFETDYRSEYPHFSILEDNFETIQTECRQLLEIKDRLPNVEKIGGKHTAGGIHSIKWKSFMFKSGSFIPENCEMAPQTAALLARIPNVYNAFFSVLDPHQYIKPHFGYWKGFVRYHLGVVIPNDNQDNCCWLRVNPSIQNNPNNRVGFERKTQLVEQGEKYFWHEGRGVIFDDYNLHDAANESDQIRVVLWIDIARVMPWYLHVMNKLLLGVAYMESSVRRIRLDAKVAKSES
jgi:aspartyl/asparaginyl beta-hydroxylase (cupin superfamily)